MIDRSEGAAGCVEWDDAEAAVLSAILMEPSVFDRVREIIPDADCFRVEANRITYRSMLSLKSQGSAIDPILLEAELGQCGQLEAVGHDHICNLLEAVPTAANVEYHAKVVARALDDAPGVEPFPTVRILAGEPKTPPSMHVESLLLDRDINLIAGHGASAKSVIQLHVGVCVALGRDVFGTLQVHRSGTVLLVCPEDGEPGVRMRLDALTACFSDEDKATLTERLILISDDAKVSITTDSRRLAATAKAYGAVLVILDPLGILLAGKPENDNDLAGATLDAIRRDVCRGADCTVWFSHHNRKPGKDFGAGGNADSVHEMRGGGAWANGSRLAFSVVKKDSRITLTANKTNLIKNAKHELALDIEADPSNKAHWLSCRLTDNNAGSSSDALTPGKGRALSANEEQALKALDDKYEPGLMLSYSSWQKRSGIAADTTFARIRERLLDAQLASGIPTGKKTRAGGVEYGYEITIAGRQALATGWSQ